MNMELPDAKSAGTVKISVVDSNRNVVSEQVVASNSERVDWSGLDRDGRVLDAGVYTVELRSVTDNMVLEGDVGITSTVEEIRFDPSGVNLVMANGSVVPEYSVLKLR